MKLIQLSDEIFRDLRPKVDRVVSTQVFSLQEAKGTDEWNALINELKGEVSFLNDIYGDHKGPDKLSLDVPGDPEAFSELMAELKAEVQAFDRPRRRRRCM